jgi:hypothetical protein
METLHTCVSYYLNRCSMDSSVHCLWIDECDHVSQHSTEYMPLTRNAINSQRMTDYTFDHPLYLIVYYSKLQRAVEWGWFYPLTLLKVEIDSVFTHRTITREDCTQTPSKPFKPRQAFLQAIPFHPPTTELTLDECFHAFEHRYQMYMTLKGTTLEKDLLQVFTPAQLHVDQQSFFVMRTISMCCLPLSVLTLFLQEMIDYEMSLFRYRIQTNWLPYALTLWTLLLQELDIPYEVIRREDSSGSSDLFFTNTRHHYWFKVPFEHILSMAMTIERQSNKRFIFLEAGYVYANEAHVYRMLPYLYKRYLTTQFFDQVIQENERLVSHLHTYRPENEDFKERIGSAYPVVYEYLGHLNANPLVIAPSPSQRSTVLSLQYLYQNGPRCIQKMIDLVEAKKHIQEWDRVLLYAAMITSHVSIPELTRWMKRWSHAVYHKQGPAKMNEQLMEVDAKIKNRLKTPVHKTFTCNRYIQAGLCGCMDPRKEDNIEDIGNTPQEFCHNLFYRKRSSSSSSSVPQIIIHYPKDYVNGSMI